MIVWKSVEKKRVCSYCLDRPKRVVMGMYKTCVPYSKKLYAKDPSICF